MWESGQPDSGIGYRAEAQKLLVMFLDSWPHDSDLLGDGVLNTGIDPGRDEVVYTGDDIDLQDDAIPAMQEAHVTLLVIYSGGASGKFVWDGIAGETGGSAVQINGDGTVLNGLSLAALILSHIQPLTGNVWWEIEADPGLTVQLEPLVQGEVEGAGELTFLETIAVDSAAPQCETLQATVTFYAGGSPEEGDVIGIQNSTIHAIDDHSPLDDPSQWAATWRAYRRKVRQAAK